MNNKTDIKTIGVIMDGNRRFAKEKGMLVSWGHKEGFEKFKEVVKWSNDVGVEHLIAYCFSSENWKRSEDEVNDLMQLFKEALEQLDEVKESGRIDWIGDISRFPKDIQDGLISKKEATKDKSGISVHLALSYGGRDEIIRAIQKAKENKVELTENNFQTFLDTANVPDPDIIIRTGGEMRLSNFLLWQGAYSELFFTKTLWPAFTKEEFVSILEEYGKRTRRFGA
jgi:undecaprenyl diphosphate synthase